MSRRGVIILFLLGVIVASLVSLASAQELCEDVSLTYLKNRCALDCFTRSTATLKTGCEELYKNLNAVVNPTANRLKVLWLLEK